MAQPLVSGTNRIGELWPLVPEGTVFWPYHNPTRTWGTVKTYRLGVGWVPGTAIIPRGEGGYLHTWEAFTLATEGRMDLPDLPVPLPGAGCILQGSQLPESASYARFMGASPPDGTRTFGWNGAAWSISEFDSGLWLGGEPELELGEALWVCTNGAVPHQHNAPPTLSQLADRTVLKNQILIVTNLVVRDVETAPTNLAIHATSSHSALLPRRRSSSGAAATGGR